jgi:3-oxoacyl-[acyl-carrier protein] reductase
LDKVRSFSGTLPQASVSPNLRPDQRRAGAPEDVARAVVYLASEFDGFITGATIDISGGVYAA